MPHLLLRFALAPLIGALGAASVGAEVLQGPAAASAWLAYLKCLVRADSDRSLAPVTMQRSHMRAVLPARTIGFFSAGEPRKSHCRVAAPFPTGSAVATSSIGRAGQSVAAGSALPGSCLSLNFYTP